MELSVITGIAGLSIGIVITWLLMRQKLSVTDSIRGEAAGRLESELRELKELLEKKETEVMSLSVSNASINADLRNARERVLEKEKELENMQEKLKIEFRNLANEILEEKSQKFTQENREKLDQILLPFNENLKDFKKKVEETYVEGEKGRASLFTKIKELEELNLKIGQEATALTQALKGEAKIQGNWGEMILESILEKSGLQKGREFLVQESHYNEEGRRKAPDIIINYPGDRSIVVDSKVSLTAYEKYANATDSKEREMALKAHLISVKKHINELAAQNYQDLYSLNTLDFVMLFMPVEPAYLIAIQEDTALWSYAYERRILLISPTNLIAALKMIESIWRQEYQTRNVLEIAEQGGSLYDDFVLLAERLLKVGKKLDEARDSYDETMKKLNQGRGNIVGRIEKLRALGVKAKKELPDAIRGDEG